MPMDTMLESREKITRVSRPIYQTTIRILLALLLVSALGALLLYLSLKYGIVVTAE
jgi:hypothetical protein